MADTERNLEMMRDLYERYIEGGDVEELMAHVADDVVWRSVGPAEHLRFARTCHSCDDVRGFFRALAEDWEMISYKVNEMIGQGERVVVLADACFSNRHTGKLVATPKADVFRLRDGKIVEFCEFYDSAAAVEAATESALDPWPETPLTGDANP
jgi:ketosteroid isomerase-like protein